MTDHKQDTFCSYCGNKHLEQVFFPRRCFVCYNETYRNPIPVVIALLPVSNGLLVEQRNIEPGKGQLAMPSGYINYQELWQEAIVREIEEEIGLITSVYDYSLLDIVKSPTGNMLMFCRWHGNIDKLDDLSFVPNDEVSAIFVANILTQLVFSSHQDMARRFFNL